MNKLCIYCKKITSNFSDEHVIPKALGGSIILKNAVCDSCNNALSKEFEMSVFKGKDSPFSFLRSWAYMKGRRDVPIFGKEGHGQPVLLTLKDGYPQIQEYVVNKETFYYPQFIFVFEDESVSRYDYIKDNNDNFKEDIENVLQNEGIDKSKIKKLYFWCDSKTTSIYGWRLFEKSLKEWAESNNVAWEVFDETAKGKAARIVININWHIIERLVSKIMLNFLFYKIQEPNFWFLSIFDDIRNFIRYGKGKPSHLLWSGDKPRADFLTGKLMTILLLTFEFNNKIFGLFAMGLPIGGHIIKLTNETETNFKKDFGLTFNYLDRSFEEFSEQSTKKIIEEIINHPIMGKKILEL
jgi:hypothetical protein